MIVEEKIMNIIAMYLPQFHRIKENDEWWGEGFTEWTAVKSAEKLYSGHNQPRVPWNDNYYDLLQKETMEWQAQLMKKYGIDGICMYHYWFKDGRQILEKPAENLLDWKDLNMPFCFCWANETWARSWSRIQEKNTWADQYEKNGKDSENGILLEQNYGNEDKWKQHFYYLLPFFKDKRYICIDEKPLFLIYKSGDIYCLPQMLELWNSLAVKEGLKGIYVIGSGCYMGNVSCMDGRMYAEPGHSYGLLEKAQIRQEENGVRIVDYEELWEQILKCMDGRNKYYEGIIGYDDTPRRGIHGWVLDGVTPEKFSYYLTRFLAKCDLNGCQHIFLNAWNEWGEGMYLEPDHTYRTAYLEAILKAKSEFESNKEKYIENITQYSCEFNIVEYEKKHLINKIFDQWLTLYEENFYIDEWLLKKGMRKIGIYGYGVLGKHFFRQLQGSNVEIAYVIDQDKIRLESELQVDIYTPQEVIPIVDGIIVTACYDFESIYRMLKENGIQKIISLAAVLFDQGI